MRGLVRGLASVGLVVAGWCCAWPLGMKTPVERPSDVWTLLAVFALCCLATLVNPYGVQLPQAWLRLTPVSRM